MYGPMNPPSDRCFECDREIEIDEPQTCYFTGGGPCGDCRDPRTNKPPYEGGCFRPLLCDDCGVAAGRWGGCDLMKEET